MAIPVKSRPWKRRYLGNSNPGRRVVHDLLNETDQCRLDEVIDAKYAVVFTPDTLDQAHLEGYDDCPRCIGVKSEPGEPAD